MDSIRRGHGQREDVLRRYENIYKEQVRKREELERNIIEKGYIEKSQREEAAQRQRTLQKEIVKYLLASCSVDL